MTQFLSPEKYIRQRARTLPIHECLVNDEWDQNQLATVFIVRKHVNGHFTIGNFLVDLKCLGVKDTFFWFNISADEYEDLKDDLFSKQEMSVISYELAHNIVFAGENFATEIGLKSHPDFYKTTQFILEEDNDNIELMDIEVGDNGIPVYVQGPYDSPVRVLEILETLDKTVGPDNYQFILQNESERDFFRDDNDFDDDDFYDEEDDDNDFDEFYDFSFEELKERFLKISKSADLKEIILDDPISTGLARHLSYRIAGEDRIEDLFIELLESIDFMDEDDEIYPSMFGLVNDEKYAMADLERDFMLVYITIGENHIAVNDLSNFKDKYPDVPAYYLLMAHHAFLMDKSNGVKLIKQYAADFPDYKLLQLYAAAVLEMTSEKKSDNEFPIPFSAWFNDRFLLHPVEAKEYLLYFSSIILKKENLAWSQAFVDALDDSALTDELYSEFYLSGNLSVFKILQNRLSTEDFLHLK